MILKTWDLSERRFPTELSFRFVMRNGCKQNIFSSFRNRLKKFESANLGNFPLKTKHSFYGDFTFKIRFFNENFH